MSGTDGRAGRIVEHTAATISKALDDMMADLPEDIALQAILELVVVELAYRQPGLLRIIMEDPDLQELYQAAVARTSPMVKAK